MDYAETLAWLDALATLGVKAGLDHTRALAARLGSPQRRFPSVLVAGTNGKGSTCAVLEAALRAAGVRTGFYSSPHLVDVRERVRVAGALVPREEFAADLTAVRRASEEAAAAGEVEGPPTFFEALTLVAFRRFAAAEVDLAVLEVGLGGRLDCTNVVAPLLCVVTSLGLDHQEFLGETVESIAREKAGIFRPGVAAVTGAREGRGLETLRAEAERLGAHLREPGSWRIEREAAGWRLAGPGGVVALPPPGLPGEHQFGNAALAVRAALALRSLGWRIPDSALREAVAAARWPGRLQRVLDSPATWLDGAHNPDGCEALARFAASLPRPRALVFASMADKPHRAMAEALFGTFDRVWLTALPMKRCASPERVREASRREDAVLEPSPARALEAARRFAGPDGSVVAGGSLYLAGHLLAHLGGGETTLYGTGL